MRNLFALVICLMSALVTAQTIVPGEYSSDGYGILNVGKPIKGKSSFNLFSLGANGHMCEIEGDMQNGKYVEKINNRDESICQIDFKQTKEGVAVSVSEPYWDACRGFCGARAGFTGDYVRPPRFCTTKEMKAQQKNGINAYRQKKYNQARADLSFILNKCSNFIDWRWEGSIRNDLALVEARRGNKVGCRSALKPYMEELNLPDDELEGYPAPTDRFSYLEILKSARFNAKLCGI